MRAMTNAAVVLGALALGTGFTGAVELKLKWDPGKRYVFENTADSSAKMPLPGQGLIETKGKLVLRVHNDVSEHAKGIRVGHAFSSVKMRQEMQGLVMEYDSADPAKGGGLLEQVLKPLAETKFSAIYDKKGELVKTEGLDEVQGAGQLGMGKAELESMALQASSLLPGRDVKAGDTWNADVNLPMGAVGGEVDITYTLKLEEIVKKEGREMARISITGKAKQPEKGQSVEEVLQVDVRKATGAMIFDVALGQPVEYSTTVELEMGLPAGLPQAEGAPGKMPLKTVSISKLIAVESLEKSSPAGEKGKAKPKVESTAGESPAEKKARRKARKEKRKAEKANQ